MKILVIFTGGTIGSTVENGWIAPNDACAYQLIERFKQQEDAGDVTFETLAPYTVLSENISAENLNTLIACVAENAEKDYDGIIVTHGTDTLQYAAAAVAFAVGDRLPVVFVSSNLPLADQSSNGDINFAAAIALIRAGHRGVFAAYRNNDGSIYYHLATRLLRHGEANDDVHSLYEQPYGRYENGAVIAAPDFTCGATGSLLGAYTLREDAQVLHLPACPGDSFRYALDGVKAVLIQPYHSGTINTESAAFEAFCKRAKAARVPLFLVNIPAGTTYASAKRFDELGLIALPPCAAVPVYVKLWIATSNGLAMEDFVKAPLYGEFL